MASSAVLPVLHFDHLHSVQSSDQLRLLGSIIKAPQLLILYVSERFCLLMTGAIRVIDINM